MANAKVGIAGKTLRGKIPFAAATSGVLDFKVGGFKPDDYQAFIQPCRRRRFVIDLPAAANNAAHTLVIAGQTRTFTEDGTATAGELLAGVRALFTDFPQFQVETSIDADSFPVTVLDEDGDATLVAGTGTTVTASIETAPDFRYIKRSGQLEVQTAAAWTGAFDVIVQG